MVSFDVSRTHQAATAPSRLSKPMRYLCTTLATDWRERSTWWNRLVDVITANPSYRGKYHLVRCWLIEFEEDGNPCREIALDSQGSILFAGPTKRDYGFWLDTNMRYADFVGEPVAREHFERMWAASGVTES